MAERSTPVPSSWGQDSWGAAPAHTCPEVSFQPSDFPPSHVPQWILSNIGSAQIISSLEATVVHNNTMLHRGSWKAHNVALRLAPKRACGCLADSANALVLGEVPTRSLVAALQLRVLERHSSQTAWCSHRGKPKAHACDAENTEKGHGDNLGMDGTRRWLLAITFPELACGCKLDLVVLGTAHYFFHQLLNDCCQYAPKHKSSSHRQLTHFFLICNSRKERHNVLLPSLFTVLLLWLLRHITAFSVPKLPSGSSDWSFTTIPFRPDSPLCLFFLTLCSHLCECLSPHHRVLQMCIPPFLGHFILPSTSIASSLITQPASPTNIFSFIHSPFAFFFLSKLYFRSISGQKKSSPLE